MSAVKSKAQIELDEYRRTGIPYLSKEDKNLDFKGVKRSGISAEWNEDLHPRDNDGQFTFSDGGTVPLKKGDDIKTGKPLTITFNHNPNKSPRYANNEFGQDSEPFGFFVTQKEADFTPDGWETGTTRINNPLVIPVTDDTLVTWKKELSKKYGGKTGKKLTDKLIKDGYDGIVTKHEDGGTGEIILLKGKAK